MHLDALTIVKIPEGMSDSRPFGKMPISTSMALSRKLQNIRTRSTSTDTTGNGMLTVTRLFKAMLLSGCIAIAGCACVPSSIDEELDKILADVGNQYAADTRISVWEVKANKTSDGWLIKGKLIAETRSTNSIIDCTQRKCRLAFAWQCFRRTMRK